MACLVTGGTGFLGRYLVRELTEKGEEVAVLSRHPVSSTRHIIGDLCEGEVHLEANAFETVYHVAGLAHVVPRTEAEKERFFQVNADGTATLLRALEQTGQLPEAVVLVSTVAVYGREEGEELDEQTPRAATDPYGLSKRRAEDTVLAWGDRHGVRIGIVRLPLVAGQGAPGNLGAMVEAIRRGRYLNIGDGAARRSMVRAADVAAVLPVVARLGGTYHLTDGVHPSYAELSAALAAALGKRSPPHLPLPLAQLAAALGDAVQAVTGRHMPLTRRTLTKMTSTLTFSDVHARQQLGWHPAPILQHAAELVL